MFMRLLLLVFMLLSLNVPGFAKGRSAVHGYLGFGPGGLGFGVDYAMKWDRYATWGGYFHNFSSSDDGDGALAVGGFFRPTIKKGPYRLRLTVGGGMLNLNRANGDSESTIGPILGVGFKKRLTKKVDIGFEGYSYYGWFGKQTGKAFDAAMLVGAYKL